MSQPTLDAVQASWPPARKGDVMMLSVAERT